MKFNKLLPLFMAAGFALTGCGQQGDAEAVKASGFLNVGITMYEPMDYFDEDGETITGFDAELSNAFAEKLGVKTRFTTIKWDSKVLELNSKKIDLIWNGMTITEELKQNIDLSVAYATNYQCVVTKSANVASYVDADSLAGKKIAVELGSAGEGAVASYSNVSKVTSQEAALLEVNAGTSDCAVIDVTMANSVVGKGDFAGLSLIDASKIAFEKEDFGVGARKGSNLTPLLNDFFKESFTSGLLSRLSEKYQVAINEASFK